ncbi:hypothetical protein COLO4_38323 [Corchorus olitorius]|uniref:Uncharacterized protein n=1 Tax=Corchorus olitorius TaxID=93759 RepID=A0A1R3FVK4_9ROSI|nr:hypothetical protein COLO4_38323 [Corchorus olitorius]
MKFDGAVENCCVHVRGEESWQVHKNIPLTWHMRGFIFVCLLLVLPW